MKDECSDQRQSTGEKTTRPLAGPLEPMSETQGSDAQDGRRLEPPRPISVDRRIEPVNSGLKTKSSYVMVTITKVN